MYRAKGRQPTYPGQHQRAGLSATQGEHLITMREEELASLLRELRKIGYHEGVIAADFSTRNTPGVESTASNFSYHLAEMWRHFTSNICRATSRAGNDVLPDVDRALSSLSSLARAAADNPKTLSGREAELLTQLCEVSKKLKASGVQLPADDAQGKLSSCPNGPACLTVLPNMTPCCGLTALLSWSRRKAGRSNQDYVGCPGWGCRRGVSLKPSTTWSPPFVSRSPHRVTDVAYNCLKV
ncbi:hypothetical protein EHW66_10735 [Erwinia psidii]|uniref:hypothetical protein n=1 Tax=Erwinia psidii TaxID=69224 RepID=UPI00226B05B0|nr:hypothetical protein [Erwinia psidii]MCX8965463.1 hypothetical protein [Erwinia psidii]